MSNEGREMIGVSRLHVGAAFRDHFKPDDLCDTGRLTLDSCMQKGLGQNDEFDCSGLVISAVCTVAGISTEQWPEKFRHARQLATLGERIRSSPGDIAIFQQEHSPIIHLGILVARMTVIHASCSSMSVSESTVLGKFSRIRIIPADKLIALGLTEQS